MSRARTSIQRSREVAPAGAPRARLLRPPAAARVLTLAAAGALLLALLPAAPARAQDLKYRSISRVEMGGTLGRVLGAIPGVKEPEGEIVYIKGNRIRRDESEETSTIMDWETGILTTLDHRSRTYTQLDLAGLAEAAEALADSLKKAIEEERAREPGRVGEVAGAAKEGAREAGREDAGEEELEVNVTVRTDRTGRTRTFGDYTAEQVLVSMEILGKADPSDPAEEEVEGGLGIVTEVWLSTDFPEYRMMREMKGAALERMKKQQTGKGILGMLESLLTYDPRIKVAYQKSARTVDEMDGFPVQTITHFVTLPGGMRLDRDQVLAEKDRSLGDDVTDAAKKGAKDAAKEGIRKLKGRFFGRKKEPEPEPKPEAPKQKVFLRIINEIRDLSVTTLDPALFEIPPEYSPAGEGG